MRNIVVWSGGLDSTLILYDLLKKHVDVEVLVFDVDLFGKEKLELEKFYRTKFLKQFSTKKIKQNYVKLDFNSNPRQGGLAQQPIMTALTSLFSENDCTYYFGYHKGDDFFSYHHEIMTIKENICKIMDKKIEFEFPLMSLNKSHIINWCEYLGLLDFVWYCEHPESSKSGFDICGECTPCKTFKENMMIANLNKLNILPRIDLKYSQNFYSVVEKKSLD